MISIKKLILGTAITGLCLTMSLTGIEATPETATLKKGSRGNEVSRLQSTLKEEQLFSANITGYFGDITKSAVASFRRINGLIADGIVGPMTKERLYSEENDTGTNDTIVGDTDISYEDRHWMSKIIHAEAQGQSYGGKVAVGSVIMNRVKSHQFPNTVKGVIFEKSGGITQFTPVVNGAINNTPNSDSVKAAEEVLAGKNNIGPSTYFFNPAKSKGTWIVKNKKFYTKIDNHAFYY